MRLRHSLLATLLALAASASCRGVLALDEKILVGGPGIEAGDADGESAGDAFTPGPPSADADADAAACPDGEAMCGARCIAVASDIQNCGRCGRACGTSCEAGLCEPRFVTDVGPGYYVYGLADGQSYLYWTTDSVAGGAVRRVSKLGGTAETVTAPGGGPTGIIVAHPDELYVASQFGQTVEHILAGRIFDLVTGQPKAANIAIDGDVIYFTRYSPTDGDLRRIPRDGGPATVIVPDMPNALGLAVDATHLYFTTNNTPVDALWSSLKDGGGVTKLLDTSPVGDIGVDDDAVYSSDVNAGTVVRIEKDGGAVTELAKEPNVQSLAIDVDSVYWISADGNVARAPKAGGGATVLAAGQAQMEYHMVVDATDVYWVSSNSLWAVPK